MNWAFWRAKEAAGVAKPGADDAQDPAAELHLRTRRRLIGAAALLLAAVIVLPMVLDPTPRPVPDSVAIDIPSDKTPFAPRLSSRAAPAPAPVPATEPPARKEEVAPRPEKKTTEALAKETVPAPAARDSAPAPPSTAGSPSFALQAAALANEAAARDLVAKLKKAGFAPYTEKINTRNGERIRVRVGPYSSREEAEQARARLKALGIDAGIVSG